MDRISENLSSFPLERVPRFQSATSRADGAVSLDDLDQLHGELEKLLGAASLQLNTVEQYLRGDQLKKGASTNQNGDAKRKHSLSDGGKKHKNAVSKVESKPRPNDCGLEFVRLRKLDDKVARGGTCFSFETLRDMPSHANGSSLRRDPSICSELASVVSNSIPQTRNSNSVPKLCDSTTNSTVSTDDPPVTRVLRKTQSRGNNSTSISLHSPPRLDAHSRRFSSPSPKSNNSSAARRCVTSANRKNGDWHVLNGLLTPSLFGSASRVVGGRLLRRQQHSQTSANATSASQSLSNTPQKAAATAPPRSRPNSVSSPNPNRKASQSVASGQVTKSKRSSSNVNAAGSGSNRLLVALPPGFTSRHDVPKAFWRRFDELFMRDVRSEDLTFVNALRSCVSLAEEDLARMNAACGSGSRSNANRSSPKPNASEKRRSESISAANDDSPVSKRLRLRCASGTSQSQLTLPPANGPNLTDPLSIASRLSPTTVRTPSPKAAVKQREAAVAVAEHASVRNPLTITVRNYSSKRNSISSNKPSRDINGIVSPRSRAAQASASRNSLSSKSVKPEVTPNGCSKRDDFTAVGANSESGSSATPLSCVSLTTTPNRSELNALLKLVEAEKQAAFAHVRREIALLSPTALKQVAVANATTNGTFKMPNGTPKRSAKCNGSNQATQPSRKTALITDYFGRNGSVANAAGATKRQRIGDSESTANLLFCYSSDCETHLGSLLTSDCACSCGQTRAKSTTTGGKVRSLRSLIAPEDESNQDDASSSNGAATKSQLRKRKRNVADDSAAASANLDITKPLTVRTPVKWFSESFSSPANADSRLLLPTLSAIKKQQDSENVELQRLVVELRCTSEWSRRACENLVSTATRQLESQPIVCRLREVERLISQFNAKMNDPQPHQAIVLNEEDLEMARCAVDEREQLFHRLGIYDR